MVETLERQQLVAQTDRVQAQLDEANLFIARHTQHGPRLTQLTQSAGIGFYMALSILPAIEDINRFPSPEYLASTTYPTVNRSRYHYRAEWNDPGWQPTHTSGRPQRDGPPFHTR